MSRDLLLEIGVEEVPSAPLYDAVTQLKTRAAAAFDTARLSYSEITSYGAPRRLGPRRHGALGAPGRRLHAREGPGCGGRLRRGRQSHQGRRGLRPRAGASP